MQGTLYALFMHDAIYLYAKLVNMLIGRAMDYRNGTAMFELARTVEFKGITLHFGLLSTAEYFDVVISVRVRNCKNLS